MDKIIISKIFVTYVSVFGSVVADESVPPEVVEADGAEEDVAVVDLMVLADPFSKESPHGLPGGVGTDSANFCWSSA